MSAIVVDTSCYIQWIKDKSDLRVLLAPWLRDGDLLQCGVIRLEVMRGLREGRQRDAMVDVFELSLEVQMNPAFWDGTLELAWLMDRRGTPLSVPDLAIAHCAMIKNATLVTLDNHFRHIPGLKHRKDLPDFA